MGYEYCECCGKRDDRDNIVYSCCAKVTEGIWCEDCSFKLTLQKCAKCKEEFCEDHCNFNPKECCGLFFCINEEDEDGCFKDHKTKRRACGHLTCNFNKGGCIVCKGDGDVQMVKDLKKNCKSASLKKCLTVWLKETQAISKKADKEKGKSLKATPSKQSSKKRKSVK
uniref:Uncharacterized protein n=1 Tax=Chaetoceros debilis TaxID=122233 RepID=A0A7S3QFE3_9STRA|mmetsp:Transcript_24365/g.37261  ORF Transcript_24365/g.37261 Transcript_24365/m.37261 type:complete len:168 (-) Transcript_24365:20-523(-)